jgi:hypothetical protein
MFDAERGRVGGGGEGAMGNIGNTVDMPDYIAALERYISVFRRAESSVDGIRSELHLIRDDSMLPIYREAIDALALQLTVAELALEACGNQVTALWRVQLAKEQSAEGAGGEE